MAGCGQIRGRKSLKTPLNNFASPGPRFSFPLAGFFGGRLRPDKGTQVPENFLKDEAIAPSWKQLFPLSERLRARSARAFDNVTRVKPPYIEKIRGAHEQLSKSNKNRTMDSFLVVLQKLLSCSSQFSQSTKQGNPCQIFAHNSSPQILISCGWIFGGRLRPGKGTQIPANSLKQFCEPRPQILISSGWIFGGRLRPDKGTQVPENSLKQFRKPKPQILISCGWIFWWLVAAR